MAKMNNTIITTRGHNLMAKMVTGTGSIEFTKISTSDTTYNQSQLEGLTSISGVKQTVQVSKVSRKNGSTIEVEGAITNAELSAGYYLRTIALYALDPDEGEILYSVTIAEIADYVPSFNGLTSTGVYIKLVTDVSNADNVSIEVDAAAVATVGDIKELEAEITDIKGFIGYNDSDVYGLEADFQNRRFTRLAGAANRTPGALFDDVRAFGGRKRVTLSDDGEVLGYYGESGYDETGATGQVMVEQPAFYYKVVPVRMEAIEDGHGFHLRKARYYVSDYPKAGFKLHPAFIDENGNKRPFIYLSAFEGSIYDTSEGQYLRNDEQLADFSADLLASVPNSKPASGHTQALTRSNTRMLAQNRGAGWEQSYSAAASVSQLLFIIEFASFNMQETLGHGVHTTPDDGESNMSELTGATTVLGNASGEVFNDNDQSIVSYRGEENLYGNIWRWVDGFNIKPQGIHDLYVATHSFADDTDDAPYENAGFTLAKSSGYVSAFGYNEPFDWLFFPSETLGNSLVPVGDNFWQNSDSTASWLAALLGAYWSYGAHSGGFYWYVYNSSTSRYRFRGGRLVYAPPVS